MRAPSFAKADGRMGLDCAISRDPLPAAAWTEVKRVCIKAPRCPASPTTWNERLWVEVTLNPAARIAA